MAAAALASPSPHIARISGACCWEGEFGRAYDCSSIEPSQFVSSGALRGLRPSCRHQVRRTNGPRTHRNGAVQRQLVVVPMFVHVPNAPKAECVRRGGEFKTANRSGTSELSNGSILVDFQGRGAAVSAFEFVYFSGLTASDLLGGVVSLLACCVLYNVIAEDRPHR